MARVAGEGRVRGESEGGSEMKESIRITRHENGFTMRVNSVLEDDTEAQLTYLFEEQDEDLHMIDLLQFVLEYFGFYSSKHAPYNFKIVQERTGEAEVELE